MTNCMILKWKDIPAQIIVKKGRKTEKRKLHERFEKAIDLCATRQGKTSEEQYLNEWNKQKINFNTKDDLAQDDLAQIADIIKKQIEDKYDNLTLKKIVLNAGRENNT